MTLLGFPFDILLSNTLKDTFHFTLRMFSKQERPFHFRWKKHSKCILKQTNPCKRCDIGLVGELQAPGLWAPGLKRKKCEGQTFVSVVGPLFSDKAQEFLKLNISSSNYFRV